ncbi:IS110 family transposase [Nocardia noduli]|uniref:IS110 family transposase n=1 Tax=Nocardia noduli TaxID=2815722 RepID=UPI001C23129F|nr:IS110 family transposase [Nocardia noduli]
MDLWAGVDAGKSAHHCVVIDAEGRQLLSVRVANDESEILALIEAVHDLDYAPQIQWATDMSRGVASLLIAILLKQRQQVVYLPGHMFFHAAAVYPGETKTDARDAFIIADHARMRTDLRPIRKTDEVTAQLRILVVRRSIVARDRTRVINRLRNQLLEYFPALEAAFDYSRTKSALVLLTGYQTPQEIRDLGVSRLEDWLRQQNVRNPATMASKAVTAAKAQRTVVPGQQIFAMMVAALARQILALEAEIATLENTIAARFDQHRHAKIILSMPGFGPTLAAELLASAGGDLLAYGTVDRLAGACGLAPVSRDSGNRSGNRRRPRKYDRRMLRACYMAAAISLAHDDKSLAFYQRKRSEGKLHSQAVLALARRRLNVMWAMVRDNTVYQRPESSPAHIDIPSQL